MRKRQLEAQNERLMAEVSYLRGRLEEMSKAPAEVVGYVREIVTDLFSQPTPPADVRMFDAAQEATADWTDQLAPARLSAEEMEELARDWNEGLVIADELDRDP